MDCAEQTMYTLWCYESRLLGIVMCTLHLKRFADEPFCMQVKKYWLIFQLSSYQVISYMDFPVRANFTLLDFSLLYRLLYICIHNPHL